MRVAAFDLGTNSFLCLVGEMREGKLFEIEDHSKVVRLGQDMYLTGKPILHPDALARAKACLYDYKEMAVKAGATRFYAVATSAARDAENAAELSQICRELDIELEIIEGKREASLTFSGAFFKESQKKEALVVDVGGGSTEFLYNTDGEILVDSLNIGAVRLTEMFISSHPVNETEINKLRAYSRQNLEGLSLSKKPMSLWAVAGTPTSLAAVMQELKDFDKTKIDEFKITKQALEAFLTKLAGMTLEQRLKLPGMQKGREDVIIAGICILLETLEFFEAKEYIVSSRGVRYGLASELLS